MVPFEWIILPLLGAAALATLAGRVGAPYPTFLALSVAPVLLDAAYDTSLRDLRAHWRPHRRA